MKIHAVAIAGMVIVKTRPRAGRELGVGHSERESVVEAWERESVEAAGERFNALDALTLHGWFEAHASWRRSGKRLRGAWAGRVPRPGPEPDLRRGRRY